MIYKINIMINRKYLIIKNNNYNKNNIMNNYYLVKLIV